MLAKSPGFAESSARQRRKRGLYVARAGASSATAIIKNRPANNGGTVYPRMRNKMMSSGVGSIQPRVIHVTSLGIVSVCGSADVMVVVLSWLPSAVIVALLLVPSAPLVPPASLIFLVRSFP